MAKTKEIKIDVNMEGTATDIFLNNMESNKIETKEEETKDNSKQTLLQDIGTYTIKCDNDILNWFRFYAKLEHNTINDMLVKALKEFTQNHTEHKNEIETLKKLFNVK